MSRDIDIDIDVNVNRDKDVNVHRNIDKQRCLRRRILPMNVGPCFSVCVCTQTFSRRWCSLEIPHAVQKIRDLRVFCLGFRAFRGVGVFCFSGFGFRV